MIGHYPGTDGHLVLLRIACLFLTATALSGLGPLSISAPALETVDSPATLIVTKLADTNDGACGADCSLREALFVAELDDTIGFANGLAGTIKLRNTLTISKNVTINGPSTKAITISGNNSVRVFYVDSGVHFAMRNLVVANGYSNGTQGANGEVCKDGETGGRAAGGGLFNNGGVVTVVNSTFSGNRAIGGSGGVGQFAPSKCINAMDARFIHGGIGGEALGGAIFSSGDISLVNSTFSDNQALGGRGGNGNLTSVAGGAGGNGIGGTLFITGEGFISSSTFYKNAAMGGAAGPSLNDVANGAQGGEGIGGALYATAVVYLVNSTFSDNWVKGGTGGHTGHGNDSMPGVLPVTRHSAGDGGNGYGGAADFAGDAWISNCTFAGNAALAGVPGMPFKGKSGAVGSGGAIYRPGAIIRKQTLEVNRSDIITIKNTLIANNFPGGNCEASLVSEGYNLDTDGTCDLTGQGDLSKLEPKLAPQKDNGGLTFILLPGSPAIDAGNPAGCTDHTGAAIVTDQRGQNRFGRCDIGAIEFSH